MIDQPDRQITAGTWFASCILVLLLILCVPLFIRMPLATDVVLYDVQAETVLKGGTLYQDMFETNLPGIVWLHMLIRPLIGMSSDALRCVDSLFLTGTVALLMLWNRRNQLSVTGMLWVGITLYAFYFSLSEWCHFQRDTIILLPALGALWMRRKQLDRLCEEKSPTALSLIGWAFLEGLLWATAFWIKPFVAIPALCVWLGSVWLARRWRGVLLDWTGLLAGGLFLGAMGIAWLWQTGAWPWFLETFLEWNPEYVAARKSGWTFLRFAQFLYRFYPWFLLHLFAIPLALIVLKDCWGSRRKAGTDGEPAPGQRDETLLSLLYLGWLTQSLAFQHLFDYVHPPSHLLAITVIGGYLGSRYRQRSLGWGWKSGMTLFALLVVLTFPSFKPERARLWKTCLTQSSNAELKARLALLVQVDWEDLEAVKQFLAAQKIKGRELHCYNSTLIYLYPELNLQPATRFGFFDSVLVFCRKHREDLHKAIEDSPQKFIVTDLIESGFNRETALATPENPAQNLPPQYPVSLKGAYPWSQPVVFRSGRYLVHQVQRPLGKFVAGGFVPTESDVQKFLKRQRQQQAKDKSQ
ncbi:hypothetical protein Enr10x_24040 [Gimesia panareensis]|uniref:Glycosyltransferase RgtA/B/C/D-like domain-containing protein n=1 Tax=Gimesia panareensis TaxID=2527978 RepID=A0A517Q618_9PLAN|nr:hypothetical protein [Gimesia panareensis]QDT27090.1 hypothetical protein Enr10x_24040 [Gimesia panareensis]